MYIELERSIAAPSSKVFRFFADPQNRPLWQRSLKSVSVQTPATRKAEHGDDG